MNNKLKDFAFFERALSKLGDGSEANLHAVRDSAQGELEASAKLWFDWRSGVEVSNEVGLLSVLPKLKERPSAELANTFEQAGSAFDKSWEYLTSNLTYMAYALVVFLVVSAIYLFAVWPSIGSLFTALGEDLPEGVRSTQISAISLIAVSFLFVGIVIRYLHSTQKRLVNLAVLPTSVVSAVFLKRFQAYYHIYLLMLESQLRGLGLNQKVLESLASEKSLNWVALKSNVAVYVDRIDTSASLGFSNEEFELLAPSLLREINSLLFTARSRLILFTQVLVFVSIGAVLAAMYMPIFSLGVLI